MAMIPTLEVDVDEVDRDSPLIAEQIVTAIRDSGMFYRDSDGGWVCLTIGRDGKTFHGERLGAGLSFSEAVKNKGILYWARAPRGSPILRPLYMAFHTAYDRWLDKLPSGKAHLFEDWPKAEGIYSMPAVVIERGRLMEAWGGAHHGLLFCGKTLQPVPVSADYPHLRRWFSSIEFTDERYRANLYGWVLASLARPVCEQFPFLLVDGAERKVGKSTVAEAICYFLSGEAASPITHTGDESEFEKRVAGKCGRPGPNVIYIDNVRPKRGATRSIRSQLLATAATNAFPSIRPVYGRKPVRLDFPILIFTMNDGSVENDLHDRALRVVLGGQAGRYFDPNPLEYVKQHRAALLSEATHLLSTVRVDGEFKHVTRLGTWERVATRAAAVLGFTTDYNPDAGDTSDALVKELDAVIQGLNSENGGRAPTLSEIAGRVTQCGSSLPELTELLRRNPAVTSAQQGNAIRKEIERLAQRSLEVDAARVAFNLQRNSSNQYVVTVTKTPIQEN